MLSKVITIISIIVLVASLGASFATYSRSLRSHAALAGYDIAFSDVALGENDGEYVVTLGVANRGTEEGEIKSLRILLWHTDKLIAIERHNYENFILESGDSREVELTVHSNLRQFRLPGTESVMTDDWSVRVQMQVDIPVRFDTVTIQRQSQLSR